MHQLEKYIADQRMTQAEFAEQVGCTQVSVSRWIAGVRMPRRGMLVRIIEATGGAVTANDFLPAPEGEAEPVHDGEPA